MSGTLTEPFATILDIAVAPLALLFGCLPDPDRKLRALRAQIASEQLEADAWAITEEFSVCSGCGSPVDPGAKRCRGGCRV